MYAARNNLIKSAIAIAVGSYAFSPLEAAVKTFSMQGRDLSNGGRIVERKLVVHINDDNPDLPAIVEFEDVTARKSAQYFYTKIRKHGFHLVETTELDGTDAKAYSTIIMLEDVEVAAIRYDLQSGKMQQMVHKQLTPLLKTTVKESYAAVEAPDPVFTILSDPEECDHLFAAIKHTTTTTELSTGTGQLGEVATWDVTPLPEKTKFVTRVETLEVGEIGVVTRPEVALAMVTRGISGQMLAEDDSTDHFDVIANTAKTRMSPVLAVTVEGSSPDLTKDFGIVPTLMITSTSPTELVLTVDMLNPVASVWSRDLVHEMHSGSAVKILHRTTGDLIEACNENQQRILHALMANPAAITDDQIQELVHLEQGWVMLTFVQNKHQDTSFTAELRTVLHQQMFSHLRMQLLSKFKHEAAVVTVLNNDELVRKLDAKMVGCCGLAVTGDQLTLELLIHQKQATERTAQALVSKLSDAQVEQDTVNLKLNELQQTSQKLQAEVVQLQQQLEDEAFVKFSPAGLKVSHLDQCTGDEDTYVKVKEAASRYPAVSPTELHKKWVAAQAFAEHVKDRANPENVARLKDCHKQLSRMLTDEGEIKHGKQGNFETAVTGAGFDKDVDTDAVRKYVHVVSEDEVITVYDDVTKTLKDVNMGAVLSGTIGVSQTGLGFPNVRRFKSIAQTSPDLLSEAQDQQSLTLWVTQLVKPSDIPPQETLDYGVQHQAILEENYYDDLAAVTGIKLGSTARSDVKAGKLIAFAELMKSFELAGATEKVTTLPEHYDKLSEVLFPTGRESRPLHWSVPSTQALAARLGLEDHGEAVYKVIVEIEKGELPGFIQTRQNIQNLHRAGLISRRALDLDLGAHPLPHLQHAVRAYQHIPKILRAKIVQLDKLKQPITDLPRLLEQLAPAHRLPTSTELDEFPLGEQLQNQDQIFFVSETMRTLNLEDDYETFFTLISSLQGIIEGIKEEADDAEIFQNLADNYQTLKTYLSEEPGEIHPDNINDFLAVMKACKLPRQGEAMAEAVATVIYIIGKEKIAELPASLL